MKQGPPGSGGSKPSRGQSNPEDGTKAGLEPCQTSGPPELVSAEGQESPREELDHYGEPARLNRVRLWRNAKLGEARVGCFGTLIQAPEAENHKAEEMANSKVGSRTSTGDTFRCEGSERVVNFKRG
jgi:hypothetical protein